MQREPTTPNRFRHSNRKSLELIERRLRKRPASIIGKMNAWLLEPYHIRVNEKSILDLEEYQTLSAAGFRQSHTFTTGVWPLTTTIEVWDGPMGVTEFTTRRSSGLKRWSFDTWYSNDEGIATGKPLRGPRPTRQLPSSGDIRLDWERHQQEVREYRPADGTPLGRGSVAASTAWINYQNRFLAGGRYAAIVSAYLALVVAASFALVATLLFIY